MTASTRHLDLRRRRFSVGYLIGSLLVGGSLLALTVPAAAQTADKKLEIHEWSVWGTSPNLETVNDEARYSTAMPVVVESSRTSSPERIKTAEGLTPVTIITFHGDPAADVDISIRASGGRSAAHWPHGTQSDRRLRWTQVNLFRDQPADARYAVVAPEHWFNKVRELDSLHLRIGTRDERFIAYDPVVKWALPLEMSGGPEKFTLVNTGRTPLYDVAISVPSPEGRRMAWIDELPTAPQPKVEAKPAEPALTPQLTIAAEPGGVDAFAVSPDGRIAATAGKDFRIKLWQLSDGKQQLVLEGHAAPVTDLAFLPNGEQLASVSRDKTLRIWNFKTGAAVSSEPLTDEGLTIGVNRDGKRLIAGSKDGKGLILDPVEGKTVAKNYTVHRDSFQTLAFTPNLRRVITGGGDKVAKLWQVIGNNNAYTTGAGTLKGHSGALTAVVALPDNKTAITGSVDGTLRFWDIDTRQETQVLKQAGPVASLALSANGETLAIALVDDPSLYLYNLNKSEAGPKLEGKQGGIRRVVAGAKDSWIASTADGSVQTWGELPESLVKPKGPPVEATLSAPLAAGSAELAAQTTAALKQRVVAAGLNGDEADVLLSMYARPMFESQKLVVVARVPVDELESKLTFDVYPEPTKIVRVGLVVVSDIDPRVAGEIATLVAQLGDASYVQREAAEKRLAELGPLALPALREALKQSDAEIVFRAERLLVAQNQAIEEKK